ncbi:hypothetical protein EJ08DRAFT_579045 [Tothia fuscella]|uniref:Uncharacterized protein n=1 Tax=Tothia fuscella TaxID=1048955 RepID=A0A9P4U3L9_9PEZI|nr:hypothetical protein EJ08DRAFT_579045 [Tothia fuscella]
MHIKSVAPAASLIACVFAQKEGRLQLKPENVQTASSATGQGTTSGPNQIESTADSANFINYCSGKTLTNGQQVKTGSCNGIVMGDLPSQSQMVSTVILSPKPGENIPANQPLAITLRVSNLTPGKFTAPYGSYYTAPQQLSSDGTVQGHIHITVQNMGDSLTPTQPLDASKFVYFKGVNDVGDGKGLLSATFEKGLEKGYYRVCSMNSAMNHQPVLMPVAQRGSQDDCTKFSVGIEAESYRTDLKVVKDQEPSEKMFYVGLFPSYLSALCERGRF